MTGPIEQFGKEAAFFAGKMYPIDTPWVLGRCDIGVRRTGFDDEELVLFYETSTFSDVIPAFSFVTIDQNVLFTAFFPLPIMVLRMGIVADIGRIEQAGHGILLHLEENLLRNHNGLFIGKSVQSFFKRRRLL